MHGFFEAPFEQAMGMFRAGGGSVPAVKIERAVHEPPLRNYSARKYEIA